MWPWTASSWITIEANIATIAVTLRVGRWRHSRWFSPPYISSAISVLGSMRAANSARIQGYSRLTLMVGGPAAPRHELRGHAPRWFQSRLVRHCPSLQGGLSSGLRFRMRQRPWKSRLSSLLKLRCTATLSLASTRGITLVMSAQPIRPLVPPSVLLAWWLVKPSAIYAGRGAYTCAQASVFRWLRFIGIGGPRVLAMGMQTQGARWAPVGNGAGRVLGRLRELLRDRKCAALVPPKAEAGRVLSGFDCARLSL